jgi:acetoin utilization protein AcuC
VSGWTPDRLAVAYDERLLDWQLGPGHPTDPVRAKLAVERLQERGVPLVVEPITWQLTDELEAVHTADYVRRTLEGRNAEWQGTRPDLGAVAAHMFAGTVQLVHAVDEGRVQVGFSPQGAKHHAVADRGSGFCVFNDMAWAGKHFAAQGKRVLYVDLDAHHGDGVEALTRHEPLVMTCSVHDSTIFPGTGHTSEPERRVHNFPLERGVGDLELRGSLAHIVRLADEWLPEVVLVAIGADGHATDPLSTLQYSYKGYSSAAGAIGALAARLEAPVLMGGAGGYQPLTHTPAVWATFVELLDGTKRAHCPAVLAPARSADDATGTGVLR